MSKNNQPSKETLIERLKNFQADSTWTYIVSIMKENVDFIDKQIISGRSYEHGHEGEKLSAEEVDRLRDKREVQKDLMELPKNLISQLVQTDDGEDPDLDPFPKDKRDIKQMEREDEKSRKKT